MKRAWLLATCLTVVSLGKPATADAKPRREGITGDVGIGFGLTLVTHTTFNDSLGLGGGFTRTENRSYELKPGLAGTSGSLGSYITPELALALRTVGTSYFEDSTQFFSTFNGPVVEWWPYDRLFLSGGIGLAIAGVNPLDGKGSPTFEAGFALDARVGTALLNNKKTDLLVWLEAVPAFYSERTVGFCLMLGWKWY